ncbi:MAG: hypothetical protein IT158_30970 [Bryobacterales bacterium]|nr:hypothetical protein [Bryobacterales bacterium]
MIADVIGIPDPWIWIAYLLCLVAAALCVVYAACLGRNRQAEQAPAPAPESAPAEEMHTKA